jgi:rubrerythrin
MSYLKQVKIILVEERPDDAWFDMNLRQLRKGKVRFYRVKDFVTGEWLFKLCRDSELGKTLVKAVKCPAGVRFAQLEGNTMVFQQSQKDGWLYDIISLTQADETDKLSRKIVDTLEQVPRIIKENYQTIPYEEATGKKAPGKHWVTLSKAEDEKAMITLFLLERAWTLSHTTLEEKIKTLQLQQTLKLREKKKEIDTGQTWKCPICGDTFHLKHVEKETTTKHTLKKHQ